MAAMPGRISFPFACSSFKRHAKTHTCFIQLPLTNIIVPRTSYPLSTNLKSRWACSSVLQQNSSEYGGKNDAKLDKLLEKVEVLGLDGNYVSLPELWKGRTAVVAFARHFGCILCRKRAALLASYKADMAAAGVALVLIAPGKLEQAKAFMEQINFPGEVYADPSHASFQALEFVEGVSSIFTAEALVKLITAFTEGYRQDWALSLQEQTVRKGGWQQGGLLVIGPEGTVLFMHKDKYAGDEPNMDAIISACCKGASFKLT